MGKCNSVLVCTNYITPLRAPEDVSPSNGSSPAQSPNLVYPAIHNRGLVHVTPSSHNQYPSKLESLLTPSLNHDVMSKSNALTFGNNYLNKIGSLLPTPAHGYLPKIYENNTSPLPATNDKHLELLSPITPDHLLRHPTSSHGYPSNFSNVPHSTDYSNVYSLQMFKPGEGQIPSHLNTTNIIGQDLRIHSNVSHNGLSNQA